MMNTHSAKPHPLDHVVLPVVNIDVARERIGKLGFTVAADARHPFGTENACVFLPTRPIWSRSGLRAPRRARLRRGKAMSSPPATVPSASAAARKGFRGWLSAVRMPASIIRTSSATDRALAKCCSSPGR